MRSLKAILGIGLFCMSVGLAKAQPAGKVSLIVKTARGLSQAQADAVLRGHGTTVRKSIPKLNMHVIEVPAQAVDAITRAMKADSSITRVDTDSKRKASGMPTDPLAASQWALQKIAWDQVYGVAAPSAWTRVAILDTGVDATHADLAGALAPGTSIIDDSSGVTDQMGHGTWLAGLIAARANNGIGVTGVAYDFVQIMPVKVLDAKGEGQDSDIIAGLVWAVDNGAKVVLMSFSSPGFSQSLQDAIDYAWANDVVLVAAAGNNGNSTPTFPAGDRGVIGVSATDEQDNLAAFSTFGPSVFLAAPGTNLVSTQLNNAYGPGTGTSGAAALVAGAAALMRSVNPSLTNGVIVSRLARTAEAAGTQAQTGNGRLEIARAMGDTSAESIQPAGADPVGTGGPFVGPYKAAATSVTAAFNPSSVIQNTPTAVTLRVTNGSDSAVGSLTVSIPSGVTVSDTPTISASTGSGWIYDPSSSPNLKKFTRGTGPSLPQGGYVEISFTVTSPVGSKTFGVTAYSNPSFNGSSGTASPSLDVTNLISTTVTVICPAAVVYNGSAQTPCTATTTPSGLTVTWTYSNNTNAGTATATASFAGDSTHAASSDFRTFTISKAPVTATAGSYSGTYDGAPHAPGACAVTGAYTTGVTCTNDLASVGPNVGSGPVVPVPAGAALANFEVTLVNGSWSISKAPVTATAGSYSGTYDGNTHAPGACAVTGAYTTGVTCTNDLASVGPNVGSGSVVPVPAGATLANFDVTLVNASWSISKAPVTATAGSYSGTYDGATHAPGACAVTGAYTTGVTCTNDPASVGPGVGSGSVVPVPAGATLANFNVTLVNGSWSISKAPVTATAGSYSGTYDGNTHAPGACAVTGAYTTGVTCTNDLASVGPNVGSGPVVPVPAGATLANFNVTLVNGTWSISKAPVTATAGSYSGTYDGNTHVPGACAVTGAYTTGVTCTNDLASVGPGVGSGSVVPVPAGATLANFEVTLVNGTWSISKAPVTATAGSYSGTYDGNTHVPGACAVTGAYTTGVTCTNDVASVGPNVGSGSVVPVPAGATLANFNVTLVNGSWSISKAPVTATAGSGSGTYNGSAQSPAACVVMGTYKGALTCANNPGSITNAGTYTITPAVSLNGELASNFAVTSVTGSYTISPAMVTAIAGSGSWEFNNTQRSPSPCVVVGNPATGNYVGPLTCANNPSVVGPNVGTWIISPLVNYGNASSANFIVTGANGSATITVRDDAVTRYIGQQTFVTSGTSSTTAQVTLTASVTDPTGLGLAGAKVDFIDLNTNKVLAAGVNVSPVSGSPGTGTANAIVTLSSGQYGSASYDILVKLGGNYTNDSQPLPDKQAVVVISQPGAANTTKAAGTITALPTKAGVYGVTGQGTATFSIGLQYNKSGANLQGQITLTIPQADGSVIVIKSNSLSSMAVTNITGGKASTIYAKASVSRINPDLSTTTIDGNVTLRVDSNDTTNPGDAIGFTVLSSKDSSLYYSNDWFFDSTTSTWKTRVEPVDLPASSITIG